MAMRATKENKKRDRKIIEKRRKSMHRDELKNEAQVINDCKKILKTYMQTRKFDIISSKKFEEVAESYLKPFSIDYHRK